MSGKATTKVRNERLEARVSRDQKALFQRAAELQGRTLTDFVIASVHDAVATWPETATCVAVRQRPDGMEVCAPHGLADLLDGIWRVNPIRVTPAISEARLARQRVRVRWPRVRVVPPG